jgi:hypothetical protein
MASGTPARGEVGEPEARAAVFTIAIPTAAKRTIAGRLLIVSAPAWIAASVLIVASALPSRAWVTVAADSRGGLRRSASGWVVRVFGDALPERDVGVFVSDADTKRGELM